MSYTEELGYERRLNRSETEDRHAFEARRWLELEFRSFWSDRQRRPAPRWSALRDASEEAGAELAN
jgi:hypothetical protein